MDEETISVDGCKINWIPPINRQIRLKMNSRTEEQNLLLFELGETRRKQFTENITEIEVKSQP